MPEFWRGFRGMAPARREAFVTTVVKEFVPDLISGHGFRKGLRVKDYRGQAGYREMTWADGGRARWRYGDSIINGEPHVVWIAVGTHKIF
jgi:hypothetical protein